MTISSSPMTFTAIINQITTLSHLFQLHSSAITSGLVSVRPRHTLTKLLFSFTLLPHKSLSFPAQPLTRYVDSLFTSICHPSTFCYNTAIRAYSDLASPTAALHLFVEMRHRALALDFYSFPFALRACAMLLGKALTFAQSLHSQALRLGFSTDLFFVNALLHAYSVSGHVIGALEAFSESSCKDIVSFNTMMDGLVKSGDIATARKLFNEMPERDSISWGTLVAGYAQSDQPDKSIEMLGYMMRSNISPDNTALVSALSACAQLGDIDQGRTIHDYITRNRIRIDSYLCTGLVNLYAKCGCIDTAIELFHTSPEKNLHSWNAMIVGMSMHGLGKLSLDYFSKMVQSGVKPDSVTFLGVLVGCSHAGLVNNALQIFNNMTDPEPKHYGCMVDLLGRSGLVDEAIKLINRMPDQGGDDIFIWGGLLGGCRKHGDVRVAEDVAKKVMEAIPGDGGVYSIMAGVYADQSRWNDVVNTRVSMSVGPAKRKAGRSLVKVDGVDHEFVSSDTMHPQSGNVYSVLNGIEKHQVEAQ